jgi:hypothetical protein
VSRLTVRSTAKRSAHREDQPHENRQLRGTTDNFSGDPQVDSSVCRRSKRHRPHQQGDVEERAHSELCEAMHLASYPMRVRPPHSIFDPPNVTRLSGGEAAAACGYSGTPLAATNEEVGGRDLQAA